MASWNKAIVYHNSLISPTPAGPFFSSLYSSSSASASLVSRSGFFSSTATKLTHSYLYPSTSISKNTQFYHICRAAEYRFPDPIPEFADAETEKFRSHLHKKLSKKDVCGDSIDDVVRICTEIFHTFLRSEYGGPGTLLVIPFIDMADTINEKGLPGGPQAARSAVKWAQDHVDKDWKEWTGSDNN